MNKNLQIGMQGYYLPENSLFNPEAVYHREFEYFK